MTPTDPSLCTGSRALPRTCRSDLQARFTHRASSRSAGHSEATVSASAKGSPFLKIREEMCSESVYCGVLRCQQEQETEILLALLSQ